MQIDCLMGTYGRYSVACEALACFLQQTSLSQATLLIYNQHPIPLCFDHPRVRIVNETPPTGSLRYIRQRMHDLADPSAEFIHWWDDDDLYLPWHLEDCLTHVKDNVAWKPASSWMSLRNTEFSLHKNRFEGSWVLRADYLKAAALDTHPDYTDHPVIRQTEDAGLLATTELGASTSYIYRWDNGTAHVSGGLCGGSEDIQMQNIESWRRQSNDLRADGPLVPADLTPLWIQYLKGIAAQVTLEEWERNRIALGIRNVPDERINMNRLQRSPSIVIEELGEEVLLYRPATHKTLHLNTTAAAIWRLCDGTRSLNDLVALLEGRFPDANSRIAREVQDVVDQLVRDGALTESPG